MFASEKEMDLLCMKLTMITMRKNAMFIACVLSLLTAACVSKKKYAEINQRNSAISGELTTERSKFNTCEKEKAEALARLRALEATNTALKDRVDELKNTNAALLNNLGDMATLSKKEAENLERSLESIREKDLQIRYLRDAMSKKDSVTLALVTSLKGALGSLDDEDIEINVEKGVVFISISDKMLFKSGSYRITDRARGVLGKIAKVVNDKPSIDFMVEGHTDTVPINQPGISDNWDLSVLRATSVVRVLQSEFGVDPARMTAAGKSFYVPVAGNDTAENRARNRRTRIVVLPKLDEFYNMIEEGMKQATEASKAG